MNNVQSGIIGETMRKEHRARDKWVAQYAQQFGMPLSDPGSDDYNTLLPGPTIRMRKPLPFAQAYVPSAYQAIEPGTAGAGSAGAAAAGAGAAKEVPAAGATKAQLSGAGDAPRHHAPYAYADTAVAHNPRASFGASITRSGLKAAVAHGPVDPNAGLYVRGDNTVVPRPGGGRVGVHPDMPAAGIKTRPPQQLLTHTKPNAANATGALAPARNKIGAATAAQQGAGDDDDHVAQAVPIGAAASARGSTPKYTESLAAAGAAIANGKSSGAPAADRPPSARPLSASISARLNASIGGGAAAGAGNGDLSATQLSAYNPALRPASAAVPPSPNLALQKSATLYTALNFAVKDTDQMGVLVTKVDRKSPAEDAGLKKGDLIAYVNNRPTRNVDEFFAVAAHAQGTLYLTIRRRGVAKLIVTLKPK